MDRNATDKLIHYLPGYDSDPKWGLCVSAIGSASVPPHGKYPVVQLKETRLIWQKGRTLQQFALVYISSGSGVFESSPTTPQKIAAGTVFILFPEIWHRYRPNLKTGWDEHWITFDGKYAETLLQNGVLNPAEPIMRGINNSKMLELFQHLADVVHAEKAGFRQRAAAATIQIIAEAHAMAQQHGAENQRSAQMIEKAKTIMQKKLNQPIDMKDIARSLNMSYPWFRQVFKEQTNISPGHYHLEMRINRAKRLLMETDLPIKTIAADLGFSSPYYFSRMFAKMAKRSPVQFRSQTIKSSI